MNELLPYKALLENCISFYMCIKKLVLIQEYNYVGGIVLELHVEFHPEKCQFLRVTNRCNVI